MHVNTCDTNTKIMLSSDWVSGLIEFGPKIPDWGRVGCVVDLTFTASAANILLLTKAALRSVNSPGVNLLDG